MEILLQTALKSQTIIGGIHFVFFLFSWPFVIGFLKDYHDKDRLTFNCQPKPSDYTRQLCYDRYVSSLSPLLTPLDFAGTTYGVLGFFWVSFMITGWWLKRRIGREQDVRRRKCQTRKFLLAFICHVCLQLVALVVMVGLFCGFQSLGFPSMYWCTKGNIIRSSTNQFSASNFTCNDLRYKEKSNLNSAIIAIMSVSIFLCILTMLHLVLTKKAFLEQLLGDIGAPDNEQAIGLVEEAADTNGTLAQAVNEYSRNLKASIKRQTEFQPKLLDLPTISVMKTDEIFTNLLIQHGRKPVEEKTSMERKIFLGHYGQVSGTRVKRHQEILSSRNDGQEIPKSILVTGKAGIGKSQFCQKLIRDWANDNLFHPTANAEVPEFKFAYLMTFRQLHLLRGETISLKELLNCSSILDDRCNVDESLLEYIQSHSDEVLIIIDGFDEYSQQGYIAGDEHERYPNTAQEKMPVAALCAKLMRRKILGNATVVISSRPDESNKLTGLFHRLVEITGFSPQEVKEYIAKYFRENEAMKNTVLNHITTNEELVSCAHIPVLCALMCSYMEYILKKSSNAESLPVSTSGLYSEVLKIFEEKHDKSKFSDSDKPSVIDKLSEFAAQLLKKNEFLFGEERMENFTSEEADFLRACGLLHCGPPFRVSFSKTEKHFCFTHLTVQEYLAASWFVKTGDVSVVRSVSTMVVQFMAGILSKERESGSLMEKLLEELPSSPDDDNKYLLEAKCLNEYQDLKFAKDYRRRHPVYDKEVSFGGINDLDCIAICFWLDAISALNDENARTRHREMLEQPKW